MNISDQQIDQLIAAAQPAIREVIKGVLNGGHPFGGVKLGDVNLSNGKTWDLGLFITNEPAGCLVKGVLESGLMNMFNSLAKQGGPLPNGAMPPAGAPPPAHVAPAPAAVPSPDNPFGL